MSEDPKLLVASAAERGAQGALRRDDETELRALSTLVEQDAIGFEHLRHGLSHDLRAPLRAIRSFASILERRYAESLDDKGRDFLRRVVAAGDRGESLLDELVAFTREHCRRTAHVTAGEAREAGSAERVMSRGEERALARLRQVEALRAEGATQGGKARSKEANRR